MLFQQQTQPVNEMQTNQLTQLNNPLLSSRTVKANFDGISDITIWRWVRDNKLPKPIKIGRRNFWRKSDIDAMGAPDAEPVSE